MTGPKLSEKQIENQILSFLKSKQILAFKVKSMGTFDPTRKIFRTVSPWFRKGVSDILGIYKQKFLAIEVKSKIGRLSLEQKEFLADVKANGGIGIVARSIEDVEKELSQLTNTEGMKND